MKLADLTLRGGNVWMYVISLVTDPFSPPERIVPFDGIRLNIRRRTADRYVANEIFRSNTYDVVPHGTVLDLGANIGAFSLYAAKTADRVFSFEPASENYAQLVRNIGINDFRNITPIKKAVGGTDGRVTLHKVSSNTGAFSIARRISNDTEGVDMLTLEDAFKLCNVDHVDLLKVDIEGSEYDLIEHASLDILRKIDAIAMETHPVRGKSIRDIRTRLESAGFAVRIRYTFLSLFGLRMLFAARQTKQ